MLCGGTNWNQVLWTTRVVLELTCASFAFFCFQFLLPVLVMTLLGKEHISTSIYLTIDFFVIGLILLEFKLQIISYKNVCQTANKIYDTHFFFTDHMKQKFVNKCTNKCIM